MTNPPTPEPLHVETVTLLTAVLDVITIPHASTVAHDETRSRILADRIMHLRIALENLLGSACPNVTDAMTDLRERLTEHEPIGYVTAKQAQRRIAAGATWSEAVSLDYREEAGR